MKKGKWDKAIVVMVPLGVTAIVVGFYVWLWHVAFFQHRSLDKFGPNDLANFGLLGDSFGFLTCLFAALAFGFSWLTNRSQSEELKLQRELSEKQLQMATETAYAQRLQSLRIEAETFANFIGKVQLGLTEIYGHWKHFSRVIAEKNPYFYSKEHKRIEGQLSSILVDTYEFPFEDVSVNNMAVELMGEAGIALTGLREALKLFHALEFDPPELDGPTFDVQGIRENLGATEKAMSDMESSLENIKVQFREYYGTEADRLKRARDAN